MNRFLPVLFSIFLIIICLSSCYDAHEIDDMVHVLAIGIDMGVSDKWRLTLLFETMKEPKGNDNVKDSESKGGKSDGVCVSMSVDAPTFFTGIDMLNTSVPRRLGFMHTQTIIFSEELAKSGMIGEYIAPINRFRQIRRSAHIFVVKGKAIDFLQEEGPFIGTSISKHFEQFVVESDNTGFFPHITLEEFYRAIKSTYHQAIAPLCAINNMNNFIKEGDPNENSFKTGGDYVAGELPRLGENRRENFGTAIFDGDRMVGELNGDETRYMLMLRNEFKRGFYTIQDPKKLELALPLDIKMQKKPKIKITFRDSKPEVNVSVKLDVDFLAIQSGINYEQPEFKKIVEATFESIVIAGMSDLIIRCQNLNSDIFLFGNHAARNFFTIEQWEEYDWNSHFSKAAVSVEVEAIIRRPGTQVKSSPIKKSQEVGGI
jgi:spore germination protein KC